LNEAFLHWAGNPVRSRVTVLKKSEIKSKKTHFNRQAFL